MPHSPEHLNPGEVKLGASEAAGEQAEKLRKLESSIEHSPESQAETIEKARAEANKEALLGKERGGAEKKAGGEPSATTIRKVTQKEKNVEYKKTLREVQTQLNAPSRAFSKVIHTPAVEKTSEFVGKTVARPNAIVAGSACALILVSLVYWIAKRYGYPLSGFETIGAFLLGWVLGLIFDYVRVMATGGRPR